MPRSKKRTSSKTDTFVGLDLSLNGTGVAILRRSSEWHPPELHTLTQTHKGKVTKNYSTERLYTVLNRLWTLGVFHSGVVLVAIEDYAFGIGKSATNCVFQLGEMGGTVRHRLYTAGIPFIACPISVNKKFATGSGSADKEQVAEAMRRLWGTKRFTEKEYDQSDALSLASIAAFKHYGTLPNLNTFKYQARLVEPLEIVCRDKS